MCISLYKLTLSYACAKAQNQRRDGAIRKRASAQTPALYKYAVRIPLREEK